MICVKCGQTKPDYHFFAFRGNYLKEFFANPKAMNGQCFECNAPYKCIACGEIKDASAFRVGGRVCDTCKSAGILFLAPVADAITDAVASVDTLGDEDALESGVEE